MFEERRRLLRKFLGCRQGRRWLLVKKVNKRPGSVLGASSTLWKGVYIWVMELGESGSIQEKEPGVSGATGKESKEDGVAGW